MSRAYAKIGVIGGNNRRATTAWPKDVSKVTCREYRGILASLIVAIHVWEVSERCLLCRLSDESTTFREIQVLDVRLGRSSHERDVA